MEQLREKARTVRENRLEEKDKITRETELITRALDMSNKQEWPSLSMSTNSQQTKMTTIITCALIDEACKPGIFNKKLKEACKNNNLPVVTYNLEPDTAQNFLAAMTSSQSKSNNQIKNKSIRSSTASPLNTSTPKKFSKYYNDMTKAANKKTLKQKKLGSELAKEAKQVEQAPEQANQIYTNILKELQKDLDINPLEIYTRPPCQTGLKEKLVNIEQLISLLGNLKIISDPVWVSEIKERANSLITAGYAKTKIRIQI